MLNDPTRRALRWWRQGNCQPMWSVQSTLECYASGSVKHEMLQKLLVRNVGNMLQP